MSEPGHTASAELPDAMRQAVEDQLSAAAASGLAARVREGDATLWGPPGTPEIANRLGWLTSPERMRAELPEIERFAAEIRGEGIPDVVLLGMGGSSLAPEVMRRSFGPQPGSPLLHVLDSTDAGAVRGVTARIDPARTLFVVSSKSGSTIEPLSMLAHFWEAIPEGAHFIAITDPGSGLERLARERGFRRTFAGYAEIGGRYSALSPFGIVPAALMGVDVRALLEGAAAAWDTGLRVRAGGPPDGAAADRSGQDAGRPAWLWLGAALSALARAGADKLTFVVEEPLGSLGLWLEQLFAESTGKHGTGILPVADEPLGEPSRYGSDRVFAHVASEDSPDPALEAAMRALAQAGHPLVTIPAGGPIDLGRLFLLSELAVAVAGWGLGINPFDQPNVQEAKDATAQVLAAGGSAPAPQDAGEAQLAALLGGAAPPSYVALMGYLAPSEAFDRSIARVRAAIRDATRATTTFGYGPRFLHSTGQFHKGGPPTGRFLQLLHDSGEDVAIPGEEYTFDALKHAQADGDLQTLRRHGLPAERLTLAGDDPAAALEELIARLQAMPADAPAAGLSAADPTTSRPGAGGGTP